MSENKKYGYTGSLRVDLTAPARSRLSDLPGVFVPRIGGTAFGYKVFGR